ncbi:hypothetical protein K458DRAFT_307327 [Lentithecium fluviatile CBS 122367]|uniref:Uncharacterized protein n=1 Tax=Lentithecium fluviatile CBS 122367 TaxID=1168545 RepID=A0A6G1IWA9_9PLEO|nr:hypothetical protein K458DRAFT_307327 [Lentithecium fluviatile CBS 122367]
MGKGNGTCNAQLVAKLAGGIEQNLNIQAQELKGVQTLQKLTASNTTGASIKGTSNFQSQQQAVLTIQQAGIDIRAQNQKIAQEINSPAQQGLAIVAQAQVTEMTQVMGLQGGGEQDKKTLEMLAKEVQDGTKQNMMNLMAAETQCAK